MNEQILSNTIVIIICSVLCWYTYKNRLPIEMIKKTSQITILFGVVTMCYYCYNMIDSSLLFIILLVLGYITIWGIENVFDAYLEAKEKLKYIYGEEEEFKQELKKNYKQGAKEAVRQVVGSKATQSSYVEPVEWDNEHLD